jgi:hypothetical protein
MGICPRGNNKVILLIFLLFIIDVYVSWYNCILVPNTRFGEKPNYTCGIINNKEIPGLASKTSLHIIL